MAAITGQMIGPELLKALRLEGQKVCSIDIRVATHELVKVKVERLMIDEEARAVTEVLSDYVLIPKPSIIHDFPAWFGAVCARAGVA